MTLIDRSVRPLGLTEAGKVYLAGCEELLERFDRLEKKVAAMGGAGPGGASDLEGVLRIGAIYSAGIDLLHHVRERFEEAHPRLRVEIHYGQPWQVHTMVLDHACDLGIVSYPQELRKVEIIPLRDEVMVVVCRPDHELAGGASGKGSKGGAGGGSGGHSGGGVGGGGRVVRASELARYPLVTFDAELPAGRRIRQYLREQGGSVKVENVFDNVDTIKNAVALTDQVSILPKRTVIREVTAGTLAMVDLVPRLVRPIGVIYRDVLGGRGGRGGREKAAALGEGLPAAARAFADFLIDHAGPGVDLSDRIQSQGRQLLLGGKA